MPLSFDFANTGLAVSGATSSGVTVVENTADGVKFTASSDAPGNFNFISFGNAGNQPLVFDDRNDGNDVFELTFASTANADNNVLSGTAGNPVSLGWSTGTGSYSIQFVSTGGGIAGSTDINAGVAGTASFIGEISSVRLTSSTLGSDILNLISLLANALQCYVKGTLIATPQGEMPIEALKAGDRILKADGRETTVRWLGHQKVNTSLNNPTKVNPICIAKGAIAKNVPSRDLYVSPDHAIAINGLLINASALVNDSTIYQTRKMPREGFTYYHIETDAHELILAENCASESYLHTLNRTAFANSAERTQASPTQEMDLPRVSSPRLLPRALMTHLQERAAQYARKAA